MVEFRPICTCAQIPDLPLLAPKITGKLLQIHENRFSYW